MVPESFKDVSIYDLRHIAICAGIRIPFKLTLQGDIEKEKTWLIDQLEEWLEEHEGPGPIFQNHALRAKFHYFLETKDTKTILKELSQLSMFSITTQVYGVLREPSWVFMCWNLSQADQKYLDSEKDYEMILRVHELSKPEMDSTAIISRFEITLDRNHRSQYIYLPNLNAWYGASLGVVHRDSSQQFCVLGTSNIIKPVKRFLLERVDQLLINPARLEIILSGVLNNNEFSGDNILIEELIRAIQARRGKWHE